MKYLKYIPFIFLIVSIVSCEEEIPWEAEDAPSKLVVEGHFTNELKKHQIILTQSADYFVNEPTPRVSGATVTVSGGDSTYEFIENPVGSGIYETKNEVAGIPGVTYQLDIQLEEPINGVSEYHGTEKMIPGLVLDSIRAMLYENPFAVDDSPVDSMLLIIDAFGVEPKDIENYYRVDLYRNGELMTDTIDEVQIFSDEEEFDGTYVHSLVFFEGVNPEDSIGLEISTVTEEYNQFVTGISNIANQSGNPFDMSGPPANAVGNIQGGDAVGYFRVSAASKKSAKIIDMRMEEGLKKQ